MSETLLRFITILVLISFIGIIFIIGNKLSIIISIFLITTYAFYEWITFTSKSKLYLLLFLIIISTLYFIPFVNIKYLSITTLSFWLLIIIMMFTSISSLKTLIMKYSNIVGFFIITSFFYHLICFFPENNSYSKELGLVDSKYYLLLLIILLSSIDIFSYLIGKKLGSFKVLPNISPNKTIEGYLGGYISTIIIFILFSELLNIAWTPFDILYLSIMIILAFSGDLFISLVKRTYEIKDTGNLLPGHGGLLDRLDSYLSSIPLFFLWMLI